MIPKSLLTLALLCIVFCIPAPTHAQDSDPISKVYFTTMVPNMAPDSGEIVLKM